MFIYFIIKSQHYKKQVDKHGLEYNLKIVDIHRARWEDGDWTDDSDQMVLIMQSILDKNGEVCCRCLG